MMGTIGSALRALSPHSLLRLYLAVVVCTAVVAVGAVLVTTATVEKRTKHAASLTNAATAAAQVQAGLRDPLLLLLSDAYGFAVSDEQVQNRTPEQRAQVMQLLSAGFSDPGFSSQIFPNVSVPMTDHDAVELHRTIDLYSRQINELVNGVDSVDLTGVVQQRDQLLAALDAYFNDNSAPNFAAVFSSVITLGREINSAEDRLVLAVTDSQREVNAATARARLVEISSLFFLTAMMAAATFFVGRLISSAFRSTETERNELRVTTSTLQYRNDQLNALYAVFSEITDTLSMHYVITATLRETLHVMNCSSMAVLRLLQDGELVVAGNLTSEGVSIPDMPAVSLGEGPTGRVARRGRSMRISHAAQSQLGPSVAPADPELRCRIWHHRSPHRWCACRRHARGVVKAG